MDDMIKYNHYYKNVEFLEFIDIYRILQLYEINHPCLQHAIKKLLCAGKRGGKNEKKDVQEAIDTLRRWIAMTEEDGNENETVG